MILVIGDKHYPGVALDELSMRHVFALQRELAVHDYSSAKSVSDVDRLLAEFRGISEDERKVHPEALFLTTVTTWAARVSAGEDLTLMEAIDFPVNTPVRWIPEPSDRKQQSEGKAQPRKSGAKKKRTGGDPRKTSGPKS